MKKVLEISIVSLIMTGLAFISTFPLVKNFSSGIPWAAYRDDLSWTLLNHPGDNLQVFYFFWLVKQNILGHVPLNGNPYEFNMLGGVTGGNDGLTTAPLAFISFIFSPLGDIAAYNCTLILSFVFAGVFMYLLARMITDFKIAALFAAITFTFIPLRINSLAGGQQFGFVLFLYPMIFYYMEKCIQTKKIRYSFPAALGIIALSFNEPHLTYYFFLFMGGYLPIRYLSKIPVNNSSDFSCPAYSLKKVMSWPPWISLMVILGAGMAVVLYTHFVLPQRSSDTFFTTPFWCMMGYYPFILLFLSILFATIYYHLGEHVSLQQGLAIEAASMLPLYLFPAIFFVFKKQVPGTATVIIGAVVVVIGIKLWLLKSNLYAMAVHIWRHTRRMKKLLVAFSPILFGMTGVVILNLITKTRKLAPSTESGGRTLHDVKLFSAHLQDVFKSTSSVYIGFLPICFGIIFLGYMLYKVGRADNTTKKPDDNLPLYALISVTLLMSQALAMGLALGNRSLYILFFHYVPFFNVPRISERILSITILALACVIAGVAQNIIRRWSTRSWMFCCSMMFLVLIVFQLNSYMLTKPMALTDLQPIEDGYQYIKNNIGDDVLLELPLWPGDSHQSSVYEYYTTLDEIKRVNGYTPLVSQEYIDTIFNPLHSLDIGELKQEQYDLLRRLNVKYITVHEHRDIFTTKVSPYPPLTTARRLTNSPYLEYLGPWNIIHKRYNKVHEPLHIFRVKDNISVNDRSYFYTMPVIYRAGQRLYHETGQVRMDKTIKRKVYNAMPGTDRQGFLVYGPYASFFAGEYRCSFRLKQSGGQKGQIGARIEVVRSIKGKQEVLAMAELSEVSPNQKYQNYFLDFDIDKRERLEFRVFYYGINEISVDRIVVNKKEMIQNIAFLEAEMMVGETGRVVFVEDASGQKVIEAIPGKDKRGRMVFGPDTKFDKGDHSAIFYLKMPKSYQPQGKKNVTAVVISITGDQRDTVFAKKKVKSLGLTGGTFKKIRVDFSLPRSTEISFEVKFVNKAHIQVDRIEINRNYVHESI